MKLVHPEWNHNIEFIDEKIQVLIVENPSQMYEWINDLYQQCNNNVEGRFVLSEEDKELSMEKNAFLILNPFELNINNRKILTKLYSELKSLSADEYYVDTNEVVSDMQRYIETLTEKSDYAMEYNQEIDITGIFKLFDLRIQEEAETPLEKLVDYIEVMQRILNKKLCICVNLKCYLSKEECQKLYEIANYQKIKLLLIESYEPESRLDEENIFIIDNMGCEIY